MGSVGIQYIMSIVIVSSHVIDHFEKRKTGFKENWELVKFNKWKVGAILGLYNGREER